MSWKARDWDFSLARKMVSLGGGPQRPGRRRLRINTHAHLHQTYEACIPTESQYPQLSHIMLFIWLQGSEAVTKNITTVNKMARYSKCRPPRNAFY